MKLKILLLTTALAISATGCSFGKKEEVTTVTTEVEYKESLEDLELDHYYIYHEGKYLEPYFGNTNFDKEDTSKHSGSDRVAWYMDDWTKIPTLYSGDYMVYITENALTESFDIERFEYLGYSFGLSGLKRLKSGRYAFDATEKGGQNFNKDSDAYRLLELHSEGVIIDNIGTAKLRSGNISNAGTVVGLEGNMLYSLDVYVGSKIQNYIVKADSITLSSMENMNISDYTLLRNTVLRINFPDYMNDGYYSVNGSGMFRYVKGKSYTENTDFNVPNDKIETTTEDSGQESLINDKNALTKEEFTLNRGGKTTIVISYGDIATGEVYNVKDPTAKLIGAATAYTFTNDDVGEMILEAELDPGTYTLELYGLFGRTYEYNVYQEMEGEQ